jgi:DNA-binding MarR family transcriptional regulator
MAPVSTRAVKQAASRTDRSGSRARNETLWNRPGFLARRLHQINVALFLGEFEDLKVTPVQWGVLTVIAGSPGISYTELASQVGMDRVNAANVVDRLEERGIVVQQRSETDRRQTSIAITDHGHALLDEYESRIARVQEKLLAPLSKRDQEVFLQLLRRLVDANNDLSRAPIKKDMFE